MTRREEQKGAALLIVLLLAATLSFIALASMEKTSLAAARSSNVQARSEAIWRAIATEAIAMSAIKNVYETANGKISLDDAWATAPLNIPLEDGAARIFFADASLCFNVNSLGAVVSNGGSSETNSAHGEFVRLAVLLGLSEVEAQTIADALADWIDEDTSRRPQGAEDEYYTVLPSPYRTGNQPMAAVSEVRAVKGVTRDIYALLKPNLCAGDESPSVVNVNMLAERHAPVLAAMLGETVTIQTARDIIAERPVGGYDDPAAFLAAPQVKVISGASAAADRFKVTSNQLVARAEIVYDTAVLEMTTRLAVSENGDTRVIARRIGAEE